MRCASQYEKLMRRKAFVDQYEQYGVLSVCLFYLGNSLDVKFYFLLVSQDGLMEFQNSHELVTQLVDEYAACEMAT